MALKRSILDDRQRFSSLYASQTEPMLRFFARRAYDPQLALDLAAETFARSAIREGLKGLDDQQQLAPCAVTRSPDRT
jgi:DNA-directed RNA polymerase specialized sigma24 family protein